MDIKTTNYKREIWADIAKAIAIILVIAGHTYNPAGKVCFVIYLFHMPLFFIISGYYFNFDKYKNNFISFCKSSIIRLLIPYILTSLCFYDINYIKSQHIFTFIYGIGKPINIFGHVIDPIGYAMWFILCLFIVKIMLYLFLKITNKSYFIINLIICFSIALFGIKIGQKIKLPWSIDIALVALYFSYTGYLMKKINFFSLKSTYHILIVLFCLILSYLDYKYFGLSMNERYYSTNYFISLHGAIAISILIFYICKIFEKINYYNIHILNIFIKLLIYIGCNTLVIMLFHCIPTLQINNWFDSSICILFRLFICILIIEFFAIIPQTKKIYSIISIKDIYKQR